MIVKHRRGTTKEWQEVDLIPEEGELVIEECSDGSFRCKLGTGRTRFSKLPYIDDKTRHDLLQEITSAKSSLNAKISDTESSILAELTTIEQALSKTVETKFDALAKSINTTETAIRADFSKELAAATSVLKANTASAIKNLAEQTDAEYVEVKESLASETQERKTAIDELTKVVSNNEANFTAALKDTAEGLTTKLTSLIDSKTASTAATTKVLAQQLSTVSKDLDDKITTQIGDLHISLSESINETATGQQSQIDSLKIKAASTEENLNKLYTHVNTTTSDMTSTIKKVDARVDAVSAAFNVQLNETAESISGELSEVAAKVSEDLTGTIDSRVHAATQALQSNINEESAKHNAELLELRTSTESDINKLKNAIKDTNEACSALSQNADTLAEVIDSKYSELNEAFAAGDRAISSVFDQKLGAATDTLRTETSAMVNRIVSDQDAVNTAITNTVKDLITDLADAQEAFEVGLASEQAARTQAAEELQQSIAKTASAVTADFKDKLTVETSKVYTYVNETKDKTSESIADLYNQLKTVTDSSDEKLEESIELAKAELLAKVNDAETKVNTLDKRLEATANNFNDTLSQHTVSFNSSISDVVNNTDAKINDLSSQITSTVKNYDNKLVAQADSFDSKLASTAEGLTIDYGSKLSKVNLDLASKIEETTEELGIELEELRYDTMINADLTEHRLTAHKQLIDELTVAKDGIIESISSIDQKHAGSAESILSKIATVNILIDQLTTQLATISSKHDLDESELSGRISELRCGLGNAHTAIAEVNNRISNGIDIPNLDYAVSEKFKELEAALMDVINSANYTMTLLIEENKTESILGLRDVRASIADIDTNIQQHKKENDDKFTEITGLINSNKAEAESAVAEKTEEIEALGTRIVDTNTRIGVAEDNINMLLAMKELPDGSTKADAELFGIRNNFDPENGYINKTYPSAGDAVRATTMAVKNLKDSLAQYIGTQAINGLHYDLTGEIDQQRPYTLYLTANDEVIPESGVQIISGAGGGGGGSSSSLKIEYVEGNKPPIITTVNDETKLFFTFSGTDSSGDDVLEAATTWKVNNVIVEYGTAKFGGNEFDVTKYLTVGTNKVLLLITDDSGSTVTKSWTVEQKELLISSNFDDRRKYTANEEIEFEFVPTGALDKEVVFILDGEELHRELITSDISGTDRKYRIPAQQHGAHLLEVYLEATINDKTIESNHITKDIIVYDAASSDPVIGISEQKVNTKQYSTVNIVYTVYDPDPANDIPEVVIKVDGQEVATTTVPENPNYDNKPTGVYPYTAATAGKHIVQIICRNRSRTVTVQVEKLDINITPVTAGLAFDFNPVGKSNGDIANRLWSHNGVHMTVPDDFDWTNGGYQLDEDTGDACFCIKAGSTATIDYKLFADDAKRNGKEFKLVFKTKNVANPDAVFLSCLDNTTDRDHIGIEMGVHTANIYGQNGVLELAYSEEDIIEFEFNISKDTEKIPMVMGYEDGVPSRPMVYTSTYRFKQETPKEITLGSPDCDLYIYRFKVYNTSLTNNEILNNFIADARTAEEMISRYNRNQIYDENRKLTAEALADACPWLRVYKLSAPYFTNNKSDKVKNTTIQQIYRGGDPVYDNWICRNAQHSGQGTSSNNYGAAGRNLDFIMNKDNAYFTLGDGSIPEEQKITLTRESVPTAYLNAKVNIASSNNLTNAILANRYDRFKPETTKRPFVRPDDYEYLDYIKDTMEFHNCVIFIQETDPNLTTHREFADTNWHFYAIGNIGDSKKTDDTRLTDPDDKYECCVEIMDVGLPLSDFPADTMINAMGYTIDDTTKEKVYTWAKNENIGILYEKQEDGSYALTSDTVVYLDKTYYVDILEHDDFSEDYTYGWRYISDDEDPEVVNTCKRAWIDFYRFVTVSTDEEFKQHFDKYFVKDSALYYYLFTTRYCMVDNRAKNTFWHYSKTGDVYENDIEIKNANGDVLFSATAGEPIRKWDLCWDYDNDTSLGLNNYGKQVYRYGLEDIDKDDAGTEVFRESDSTFFCRVRDCFARELKTMYNNLESAGAWHAETFIKECDAWQNEFPEELWRIDIDRKYLRTYNSSFKDQGGDHQFLENMCNGRMKYHRRQWERSQEQYMASKYQTPTALSSAHQANFRVNRFDSTEGLAVLPNYELTITPYSYMYLNVDYTNGNGTPVSVRAEPNVPKTVPYSSAEADIINVGSAAYIRDFGNLSELYADTVGLQNAKRIRKVDLGNETSGYANNWLSSFSFGDNPLLEVVNVENVTSLTSSLDFKNLINLRELYAFGTNITDVEFAADGKIEYIELPAVTTLKLKKLKYLSLDNIKVVNPTNIIYDSIIELDLENCPLINEIALFERCTNLRRLRLSGVDFGTKTYSYFEERFFNLAWADEHGEPTNAYLSGTVHFVDLTGAQYNELKARYPRLAITYDNLTSTITFKGTDLETVLHQGTSVNGADYRNPVYYDSGNIPSGMIAKPVKAPSDNGEFRYEFLGWSTNVNVIVSTEDKDTPLTDELRRQFREDAVKHVEGDRVLYPVFEAIRRSYEISFVNPTDNNKVLYKVMVLYGDDAEYVGETPTKRDSVSPDLYAFTGWYPAPVNIVRAMTCEAQFAVLDQDRLPGGEDDGDTDPGYTIGWLDISNCVDYQGNIFNGYTLDASSGTMVITECNNNFNTVIKIPETLTFAGVDYSIISVGGFNGHDRLEIIYLPETLTALATIAFEGCTSLTEITLPESLEVIGSKALHKCSNLSELVIPVNVSVIEDAAFAECANLHNITVADNSDNAKFKMMQDCLVNTQTKKLIQGLASGTIPQSSDDVTTLGTFCFASLPITSIEIPDNITALGSNAFSHCEQLQSINIPSKVTEIPATCFAWCYKLKTVSLPSELTTIWSYAFDACDLENVDIPAAVDYIYGRAFGDMPSLNTVTFNEARDEYGNIKIPNICSTAFAGSGSATSPIVFNVPWSENKHYAYFDSSKTGVDGQKFDPTFGAAYYTFNFGQEETN